MKFLFASDSFKGSLTSRRTAELLTQAAGEIFPGCVCGSIEIADGGEGTADAVLSAAGGTRIYMTAAGPLTERVPVSYVQLDSTRAVMEMAAASGLPLVPAGKRNPLETTTYGTGEMIADAVSRGFRDISIAIGGSATNDGGMGCMRALGVRFLDGSGRGPLRNGSAGEGMYLYRHVRCHESPVRSVRRHIYLRETEGGNP